VARDLRYEGPIPGASENLIKTLLHDHLAPVVRELVGAIVRFEWYFKPLQMSSPWRTAMRRRWWRLMRRRRSKLP
jgi:hypothetical protein